MIASLPLHVCITLIEPLFLLPTHRTSSLLNTTTAFAIEASAYGLSRTRRWEMAVLLAALSSVVGPLVASHLTLYAPAASIYLAFPGLGAIFVSLFLGPRTTGLTASLILAFATWRALTHPQLSSTVAGLVIAFVAISTLVATLNAYWSARGDREKRSIQTKLLAADRMASMGLLAAGVGHELNNPLAYISANLDFLQSSFDEMGYPDEELREALLDARHGARRMGDIVRELRVFTRQPANEPGPVDLRALLRSTIALCRTQIRHQASLVAELDDVPLAEGIEGQLGQVFLNLLVNAAQAFDHTGIANPRIQVQLHRLNDFAEVRVIDNGPGVPAAIRDRIFAPFFTTKPPGVGTGLGLSLCLEFARRARGRLWLESPPQGGSTFVVQLPLHDKKTTGTPNPPPVSREILNNATLLIVDDELPVAHALKRSLIGCKVVIAADGQAALDACLAQPFDAILCDLIMPKMSGMGFYERLCATQPKLAGRVIFLTGGAVTDETRKFIEQTAAPVLYKPVQHTLLSKAIESVVSRADATGDTPMPSD